MRKIPAFGQPFSERYVNMWDFIMSCLRCLYGHRSDETSPITNIITWRWVCSIIVALIIKDRPGGISEIVRVLNVDPSHYNRIDDIFRSDAIRFDKLQKKWYDIVQQIFTPFTLRDRKVFTGDGVMNPKESRKNPVMVRLHKESGTQSKPVSFYGVHVGAIDIVVQSEFGALYCVPLSMEIMQGLKAMTTWDNTPHPMADLSLEVQEIDLLGKIVSHYKYDVYYLSDRASMNQNVLSKLLEIRESAKQKIDMITVAKSNTVGYLPLEEGEQIDKEHTAKINDIKYKKLYLSEESAKEDSWEETTVVVYGKKRKCRYKVLDLFWGQDIMVKIRFIICELEGSPPFFIASTDTELPAVDAIKGYARRFLCEERYKVFKHVFLGFDFHFWTKSMPHISFYRKKDDPDPLSEIQDIMAQTHIIDAVCADELYLQLSCIAQGLAIGIAAQHKPNGELDHYVTKRNYNSDKVSEETVCRFLSDNFLNIRYRNPNDEIIRFLSLKSSHKNYSVYEKYL